MNSRLALECLMAVAVSLFSPLWVSSVISLAWFGALYMRPQDFGLNK
jgi:hypothetical protein